jgi:hypothetical protein
MTKKAVVARVSDVEALIGILERGGVVAVDLLAKEMGRQKKEVRSIVREARQQFLNSGKVEHWIYKAKGGYTIEEKPEHAAYEMRMRMAMGFGVISNGQHVYKTLKKLNFKMFDDVRLTYKPNKPLLDMLVR